MSRTFLFAHRGLSPRVLLILGIVALLTAFTSTSAFALECTNLSKPVGAGAITFADIKVDVGNTTYDVLPGGFVTIAGYDTFIHGGENHEFREVIGFRAVGLMVDAPQDNGTAYQGVADHPVLPPN